MHWLIQDGFDNDPAYNDLLDNLNRMDINYTLVKVIPFSDDGIISEIDLNSITENIFTYGSYTLSKIAKKRGYTPGAFLSENSNMKNLLLHFGEEMLNCDMVFGTIGTLKPIAEKFFCRPLEDTKSFTAKIMDSDDYLGFQHRIVNFSGEDAYSTITKDTEIIMSSCKNIISETRFFIVDAVIVTYSQYMVGNRVLYKADVDQYIIDYAQKMVDHYQPDIAYVLDIAVNSDGIPKVLEVNNINSSGLYAINNQKFINAIEMLTDKYVWLT
jgi:hypothetical protein